MNEAGQGCSGGRRLERCKPPSSTDEDVRLWHDKYPGEIRSAEAGAGYENPNQLVMAPVKCCAAA